MNNVIIVTVDQLRTFSAGCYGNNIVNTPNIDKFAKEGFRFDLGVSGNPVCIAARASLLSGQHARTCVGSRCNEMEGFLGRNDRCKFPDITIAEEFKKLGYKTAQIGKWHIDARPSLLGFDESLVVADYFTKGTFSKNEGDLHEVPGFTSDYEIANVKKYIKDNKSRPFFLYYNITSPHMPLLDVPYKYSRMYDPGKVPLRENVWKNGELPSDETWFHVYMSQTWHDDNCKPITAKATPDFTVKDLTALYYGSVTWADDLFGEMMDTLNQCGLEKDTIVVFASDHGDMLGSHHRWNKDCVYEESIRIPMIYSWPGKIKKGVNDSQVTSLIDVMPTVLNLCDAKVSESIQGRSVASLMDGSAADSCFEDNYTFIESPYRELAIRTPTHLYGAMIDEEDRGIRDDKLLFFDMRTDPFQQDNLLKSGRQGELAKELRKMLYHWDENTPRLKTVKYKPWCKSYGKFFQKTDY